MGVYKYTKTWFTHCELKYSLINFLDNTQDSYGRHNDIRKISLRPESEKIKNM